MNKNFTYLASIAVAIVIIGTGQAISDTITFDNINQYTMNPIISSSEGDVHFFGGSSFKNVLPFFYHTHAIVENYGGNNKLFNGIYEGDIPALPSAVSSDVPFIGVSIEDGFSFNTVSFNINMFNPSYGSYYCFDAFSGDIKVSSQIRPDFWFRHNDSYNLSVSGGFDSLYIYNPNKNINNGYNRYDFFIDNFEFTSMSSSQVPEPGTLVLLGAGMLCLSGFVRKKQS